MIRGRNWFVLNYKITKSVYSITIVLSKAWNTFFAIKFEKKPEKWDGKSHYIGKGLNALMHQFPIVPNNKFNWFRTTLVLCSYNNYCKHCNIQFYRSFISRFFGNHKNFTSQFIYKMCENHNNDWHRCFYSSSPILMGFWRYNAVVSRCHRG